MFCKLNLKTTQSRILRNVALKHKRGYAKQIHTNSKSVRQSFIDYFIKKHGHTFIRSSPVVPFCDPTVAFVNAGMNQFKGVFLDRNAPPCKRAVNSQKCIRVGGKHNDLQAVGADSYHHTFFEMLGNWSFGDYFKKEACEMAWNLLTGPYGIPPSRLYVTYFGGDITAKLAPDLETQDIWRTIGVPLERILPFGLSDNFWEMGPTGPCGPATEIHVDHMAGRDLASDRVNKGFSDLTELWNIVFIQYNRLADGSLCELPCRHVDTGMGLERLLAVLNNKQSNYDTDLFMPIFRAIEKRSKGVAPYGGLFGPEDASGVDTAYRILADHARMVTVALADGMLPDSNHKLRRVLRKALLVSRNVFGVETGMLQELTNHVAESLGEFYPEIPARLKQVQLIVAHEEYLLKELQGGAATEWAKLIETRPQLKGLNAVEMPGLVKAYQELQDILNPSDAESTELATSKLPVEPSPVEPAPAVEPAKVEITHTKALSENVPTPSREEEGEGTRPGLTDDIAFKLYDTYGLDVKTIAKLAAAEHLCFDQKGLEERLEEARVRSRGAAGGERGSRLATELRALGVPPTDVGLKYDYRKELHYVFPEVECSVLALVRDGGLVGKVMGGNKAECGVVLDRSNFYTEAGGQQCDRGWLRLESGADFKIEETMDVAGYLVHYGYIEDGNLHVGDMATLELDFEHRLGNMRNHTATHLINAALRRVLTVTAQRSSRVNTNGLTLDFSVYGGERFSAAEVERVEAAVNECVRAKIEVKRRSVGATELLATEGVTLLPGEVYPEEGIHLVEIVADGLVASREACCGTHVLNTADLEEFVILALKTVGTGTRSIRAITGPPARAVHRAGRKMLNKIAQMENKVSSFLDPDDSESNDGEALGSRMLELRKDLSSSETTLPYAVRSRCTHTLDELLQRLKDGARTALRESLESEMNAVLKTNQHPFLVHFLGCSSTMDSIPLQKATKLCDNLPVLLLAHSEGALKARCCVPKSLCSATFNAQIWMQQILSVFKASGAPPKGQDPTQVFNMRPRKIPDKDVTGLIMEAVDRASRFASSRLPREEEGEGK